MTLLEFSEEQQCFHYNDIVNGNPMTEENSNGYRTLIVVNNTYDANSFADFLQVQFLEKGKGNFDEMKRTVDNLTGFLKYRREFKKEIKRGQPAFA